MGAKNSKGKNLFVQLEQTLAENLQDVDIPTAVHLAQSVSSEIRHGNMTDSVKRTLTDMLKRLVLKVQLKGDECIQKTAEKSSCANLEVVLPDGTRTCFSLTDLKKHWSAEKLTFITGAYDTQRAYTLPPVKGCVLTESDVRRVQRCGSGNNTPIRTWFMVPRELPSSGQSKDKKTTDTVFSSDGEYRFEAQPCMLSTSNNESVIKEQLRMERYLTRLPRLTGGGGAKKRRPNHHRRH